jgi:hypothetical protein
MSKNKGGREIRKPKQTKQPKPDSAAPMGRLVEGATKKSK